MSWVAAKYQDGQKRGGWTSALFIYPTSCATAIKIQMTRKPESFPLLLGQFTNGRTRAAIRVQLKKGHICTGFAVILVL